MISYVFVNDDDGSRVNLSVAECDSYIASGYWFQWLGVLEPGGVYVYEKWYDAEQYRDTPLASSYASAIWAGWDFLADEGITSAADFWHFLLVSVTGGLSALGRRLRFWATYLLNGGDDTSGDPVGHPFYVGSPQNWYDDGKPGHWTEVEEDDAPDLTSSPWGGSLGAPSSEGLAPPAASSSKDDGSMVPAILAVAGIAWLVFKG